MKAGYQDKVPDLIFDGSQMLLVVSFLHHCLVFSSAHLTMLQLVCICLAKLSAAGMVLLGVISEGWPMGCHPLFNQKGVCPVALCNELL